MHAASRSNPLLDDDIAALYAALDKTAIVAATDARGNIVHVNSEFVRISGYSREELIGQNHRLLNSGRHGKDFWREMYRTVVRGEVWRGQVCNRAKDGHEYWVDTAVCCTFDQDGKVHRFVAVRFDISKEKAHEANLLQHSEELEWAAEEQSKLVEALETSKAELEQKNAQLERAVAAAKTATRTKNEFLANMSHEIRTPMTAILGYADLLAEESAAMSETNREYLGLIRRQGRHLLHLLNDILDLAKFEAGRMTLEQIPVDIRAVVEDVASLYAEKARAKGVLIGCRVEPDVPQLVTGDPTRLRQI
ncbi:MAG: PAS domain S-box protein, partial [Phycisphaerales bacterium]